MDDIDYRAFIWCLIHQGTQFSNSPPLFNISIKSSPESMEGNYISYVILIITWK